MQYFQYPVRWAGIPFTDTKLKVQTGEVYYPKSTQSESVSCLVVSDFHNPVNCNPPGSSVHGILEPKRLCSWRIPWSGQPFISPGNLPNPESEPGSPALQTMFLLSEPSGKSIYNGGRARPWDSQFFHMVFTLTNCLVTSLYLVFSLFLKYIF